MFSVRRTVASVIFLAGLAWADTCDNLQTSSTIDVSGPLSLSYADERLDYWSTSCRALKPTCIIFPKDAEEVSAIVKSLNSNSEPFAVKSGGHNPNNYWSSVDGGPLISTQKLDKVILDQETGIATVGPGQRLDSISAALDGTGWTFVGGRIGNTGGKLEYTLCVLHLLTFPSWWPRTRRRSLLHVSAIWLVRFFCHRVRARPR